MTTSPDPTVLTRRQVIRSAAALAGAFAVAGCVSDERPTVGSATVPVDTTLVTTPPPTVGLVGDSISYLSRGAIEPALRAQGFGRIEFDALPGRRIVEGESSGLAVLDFAIGAGLAPQLWIVELGSNDLGKYAGFAGYAELISLVLERLPAPTPLVWVDTYSSFYLPDCELFNATLRDAIAARGNAAVGEWYAKCVEVGPAVLVPDGLHPNPSGYQTFADVTVAPIAVVAA